MPFKNPALFDQESPVKGFTVSVVLPGATAATAANYGSFWIAPAKCVVDSITYSFSANSNSGTVEVEKVPSATAQGSGTNLQTATVSTASGANTNQAATLSTTAATVELAAGDRLALEDSGTLTSLTDLVCTVGLHWIP